MGDHMAIERMGMAQAVHYTTCARLLLVVALVLAAGVGCVANEPRGEPPDLSAENKASLLGDTAPAHYDFFKEYHVRPGDILEILYEVRTWEKRDRYKVKINDTLTVKFIYAPELNETQQVRPDGYISLPYVGEYYVFDKTIAELHQELGEKYGPVLKDPELYVVVSEFDAAIKELKEDLRTWDRGLGRPTTVRIDGYATFPMLGEKLIANRTIAEIADELNREYARLSDGLSVDLSLEKHGAAQVYVLGHVFRAGAYEVSKPLTVTQALSLAQSYKPGARLDSVIVARRVNGTMRAVRVDVTRAPELGGDAEMLYLQPDDIVFVPKTWVASTAEVVRDITDVIKFRGWGFDIQIDENF
jgi:polysaccharide export outer membrane protein